MKYITALLLILVLCSAASAAEYQEYGYEAHIGYPADLGYGERFFSNKPLYGLTLDWMVLPTAGFNAGIEISPYALSVSGGLSLYPWRSNGWSIAIHLQVCYFAQRDYLTLPKMGGNFMFKENIELRVPLWDHLQLTVGLYHWSNAGIANTNPGVEVLYFGVRFYGP